MKFNPFRSKKIKFPQKPAKIKQAGEKSPVERNESAERVNRTVYLTVAVLLIVLAAAVAMTSAANKARRGQPAETSAPETTLRSPETVAPAPETTAPPAETQAPADTAASGEQTDVPVAAGIPTLSLPAEGFLGKEHDPTVQVFSNTLGEWRVHLGIDIMTEAAAPVYAAAKGKVKQIADDPLWGKCIWIEHDGDAVSVYRGKDVCHMLKQRNPLSLRVITLLDKPSRRLVEFEPDLALFTIPDHFVIGYGLDCAEYYRNLPYIAEYQE